MEAGGGGEEGEGIKQRQKRRHRQRCSDDQRQRGGGFSIVMEIDLTQGGEHTIQGTDDVYRIVYLKPT